MATPSIHFKYNRCRSQIVNQAARIDEINLIVRDDELAEVFGAFQVGIRSHGSTVLFAGFLDEVRADIRVGMKARDDFLAADATICMRYWNDSPLGADRPTVDYRCPKTIGEKEPALFVSSHQTGVGLQPSFSQCGNYRRIPKEQQNVRMYMPLMLWIYQGDQYRRVVGDVIRPPRRTLVPSQQTGPSHLPFTANLLDDESEAVSLPNSGNASCEY